MQDIVRIALVGFSMTIAPLSAHAQHDDHDHQDDAGLDASSIGSVNFETSCKPEVKGIFNRAVSLLHSFWFLQSRAEFERALAIDSNCAIAHWGIALTHWGNPFAGLRTPAVIALGKAATDKARSTGTPSSRERGYIDAVSLLFSASDAGMQRDRVVAYQAAMQKVAADHPHDVEAQIFAALAIAQAATPEDKTFERQLQAGTILEPLFDKMPKHPGIAHYIIHAYDVPPLAPRALPAARAYADIAPAVSHALHMPSHTFTRVGMWRESVATNLRSADTAEKGKEHGAVLHALDYMTYAYLQMALDGQAETAIERMRKTLKASATSGVDLAISFPAVAMSARYALERQQWSDAAQIAVPPASAPPYVEAMSRFSRALGAARTGKSAAAVVEINRLATLRERALEMKDSYWAEIIDIQRRGAQAWLSFAEGKTEEGLEMLRTAADAEDATEKSVVTPGPLAPAREMLGFMLLEAGKADEALVAFDTAIAKEPNRFLALYGAGRAAEKAQQLARAKGYYQRIVSICTDSSSARPELAYARKMAR